MVIEQVGDNRGPEPALWSPSPCGRWVVDYQTYIESPQWRHRRASFLKTHDRCERCRHRLGRWKQVHHLNYNRLGRELDSDLQALCKRCHQIVEARKGNDFWLCMGIIGDLVSIPEPLSCDIKTAESDSHQYRGLEDCPDVEEYGLERYLEYEKLQGLEE
jgi:hypothetical protein